MWRDSSLLLPATAIAHPHRALDRTPSPVGLAQSTADGGTASTVRIPAISQRKAGPLSAVLSGNQTNYLQLGWMGGVAGPKVSQASAHSDMDDAIL